MSFFKGLLTKQKVLSPPEDESLLSGQICESINDIAIDVFKQFHSQLLDKPATYVVQAVWGVVVNGDPPTPLQIEIHKKIESMFSDVRSKIKRTTTEQFLISVFLIRELIAIKLNYMISELKRACMEKRSITMAEIEVIGNA